MHPYIFKKIYTIFYKLYINIYPKSHIWMAESSYIQI